MAKRGSYASTLKHMDAAIKRARKAGKKYEYTVTVAGEHYGVTYDKAKATAMAKRAVKAATPRARITKVKLSLA